MNIPIAIATLCTDRPVRGKPAAVRGFFGRHFPASVLLHQHMGSGGTAYLYPRVQYRVTNGTPQLIGIGDGIIAMENAVECLSELELNGWKYQINFVDIKHESVELDESDEPIEYRFASPWLALNQKNYGRYKAANRPDQNDLLNRILIGNVLSMSKSVGVVVTERLNAELFVRPRPVVAKRQQMIGFVGRFRLNFHIPAQLGIGHLVSIGFGEVALNQRVPAVK